MNESQVVTSAAVPAYVKGHRLLEGKSVLITAAAGGGIGFAAARRCAEEGCRALMISDIHEGRLAAAVERLRAETGLEAVYGQPCNVTSEAEVQALIETPWSVATLDFVFPDTRGQRPADFGTTLKFGIALTRLAAEDPAVHKLTAEVQNLLRPRSVYSDPALVQRVLAKMAET